MCEGALHLHRREILEGTRTWLRLREMGKLQSGTNRIACDRGSRECREGTTAMVAKTYRSLFFRLLSVSTCRATSAAVVRSSAATTPAVMTPSRVQSRRVFALPLYRHSAWALAYARNACCCVLHARLVSAMPRSTCSNATVLELAADPPARPRAFLMSSFGWSQADHP